MSDFFYGPMFPLGEDTTDYRHLGGEGVDLDEFRGRKIVRVDSSALTRLMREAFRDVSFLLRTEHLQMVARILDDSEATENDRRVARALLENAVIASEGVLPLCQDTGTAIVIGKKGQQVWTEGSDAEAISRGIYETYAKENLRYSQVVPLTTFEEQNSGNNLPAQIDIYAVQGTSYDFLCLSKGGGSANKTFLYQETKALLNPDSLLAFLDEKMKTLGTAACPPYHIAVVVGGTSAEANLKTVKLASAKFLDGLPTRGNFMGQAFRDRELEDKLLHIAEKTGIGAQFGGKYFALDLRVIRLPRHGASCPIGLGVSCSADRQIKARIDAEGLWLERLERDPKRFLPEHRAAGAAASDPVSVDLDRPMAEILGELTKYPIATALSLTGTIVVARDIAHAKIRERLERGEEMPEYLKRHPVYYAGPAKTPDGFPSGSFGPTTAGRMDSYVDLFQSHGGSLIMIAKGNRSKQVTDACRKHGGFYLGSIGGPAALLATESIRKVEVIEYPELGMEAIYRIEVENFPAYILIDDKGNDFFLQLPQATPS